MLQQTQVKTVIPYFQRFLEKYPTIQDLAASDLQTVLKLWEGLGYYGRARNMHRAAHILLQEHHGRFPDTWKHIHALPGIGDYIAAAVLSIVFNAPYAVVDGNVKRVLARLFRLKTPVNQSKHHNTFKKHADKLLFKTDPGKYNQAMMELGALICTPSGPFNLSAVSSVLTKPGATAPTNILYSASATANDWLREFRPALLAP